MTSVNKIVQTNVNFKPWMFKNTNEIVNAYVQKLYKQIPSSFNKDIKTVKVASPKSENRGPLSNIKNRERQLPLATISPRTAALKKSNSRIKQQSANLMNLLQMSKNNAEISQKFAGTNLGSHKRLLKTPNYKIYRSLRYGSSSSSSRSSLFKRFDERRRQRQTAPAQVNYLKRSFHTSKFEPTYARFLMPARNQQRHAKLGSIPDAIKFSNDILKDLMKVNKPKNNETLTDGQKKINLDQLNHPPLEFSKYELKVPKESAIKIATPSAERNMRKAKLSPEHREYARLNVGRSSPLKHPRPPNELFTAQHDRNHTELHEKHRRNRMKKLGLIKTPSSTEAEMEAAGPSSIEDTKLNDKQIESESRQATARTITSLKQAVQSLPKLCNQAKDIVRKANSLMPLKKDVSPQIKPIMIPFETNKISPKVSPKRKSSFISSHPLTKTCSTISPIVAARAQMPNRNDLRAYRYNRSDFFSTKKY